MSSIGYLLELQQTELEIEDKLRSIAKVDAKLTDNSRITALNNGFNKAAGTLSELKKGQQSLDWEMEELEGKIARDNQALYSGQVKNPKELTGLQKDSEILKGRLSKLEEQTLALMEQIEENEIRLAQIEQELALAKEKRMAEEKDLNVEKEKLSAAIAQLEEKKKELEDMIEASLLKQYRELRQYKGKAVALVEQGICRGCGISLSSAELRKTKSGALVRCDSCSRILYVG
jgi:predicted  nucleic acid-binding Zn-ribbon protein